MMKRFAVIAAALTVLTTFAPRPVHAASKPKSFVVAVPFDSVVGNRTMPAATIDFRLSLAPRGKMTQWVCSQCAVSTAATTPRPLLQSLPATLQRMDPSSSSAALATAPLFLNFGKRETRWV